MKDSEKQFCIFQYHSDTVPGNGTQYGARYLGFWLICLKGLTPIPFKIVTIASGFAHVNLWIFAVASMITRSMRFLILSYICKRYGDIVLNFMEKNKKLTLILIVGGVIFGFLLVKLFA